MLEKILKIIIVGAEQASLRLALAGGFAYSMYCNPRATVDLDFVIFTDDDIDSVKQLHAQLDIRYIEKWSKR